MTPPVFSWPWFIPFWITFLWAFAPEMMIVRRSMGPSLASDSKDGGSLRVIMAGMQLGMLAAFPVAFIARTQFSPFLRVPLFFAGLVALIAGSLLRRHCWRVLGEHFTGDVKARADQPVIERGAYAFVRHPSYSAGMLMFLGIGLALGSWASLALLFISSAGVYLYRVSVEERALSETIGEPYRDYMRRCKRFVPFLY